MGGWLGIDMGGTASRWHWLGRDGTRAEGRAPGATGMVYDTPRRDAFTRALQEIRAALPGEVVRAHLGITGAGFSRDPQLDALAAGALGLVPGRLSHENDAELAHRAAFPSGIGHLVIAGTGSVGVGRTASGQVVVGGRGVVIDDRGSASWIAAEAFRAVYARVDATGGPEGVEALAAALRAADWDAVRETVYGDDRGRLGLAAPAVARAAETGCAMAAAILAGAGGELAAMAGQLAARLGPAPVAFAGGALALSPRIIEAIRAKLPQAAFPQLQAARAAAEHARTLG